jgi:hypothetical protein
MPTRIEGGFQRAQAVVSATGDINLGTGSAWSRYMPV